MTRHRPERVTAPDDCHHRRPCADECVDAVAWVTERLEGRA